MTGPLETWLDWFVSLPPEIGGELALELMRLWPGLAPSLATPNPTDGFAPRVRRLKTDRFSEVGAAAALAAWTDLVLAERTDEAAWARTGQLLEVLDAAGDLLGNEEELGALLGGFSEHARARAPLRQRMWARAAEAWRPVRAGPLAPGRLDEHRREARLPLPSDT